MIPQSNKQTNKICEQINKHVYLSPYYLLGISKIGVYLIKSSSKKDKDKMNQWARK